MRHSSIKQSLFLGLSLCLFLVGCGEVNRDKQIIRFAESQIAHSPASAQAALDQVTTINYLQLPRKWQARYTYLQCCLADAEESDFPYAIEIQTARDWYLQKGKTTEGVALCQYLGRAYMAEKDNKRAMEAFLFGLEQAQKAGLINAAGYLHSYLGDLYTQNNHIETALSKYQEAADCFLQAGNQRSWGFAQRDMGFSYDMLELYEEALIAMSHADSIGQILNDSLIISTVWNGLGNIYLSMGQYEQAIAYFLKSLQSGTTPLYNQMALTNAYIKAGQPTAARRILDAMAQDSIPEMFQRNSHYYYAQMEAQEGNYKEALSHFEQFYLMLEKRLEGIETHNYIEVEERYNHLSLTLQLQEATINRKNSFLWIVSLSLACLILIVAYLYGRMRVQKRLADQERKINDNQSQILLLSHALEEKKEELNRATTGEGQLQKTKEIEQLKTAYLQLRTETMRLSPLRKKLIQRVKNFTPFDKSDSDMAFLSQMELEINRIYPELLYRLRRQFPELTALELQYCVLSLYEWIPNTKRSCWGLTRVPSANDAPGSVKSYIPHSKKTTWPLSSKNIA